MSLILSCRVLMDANVSIDVEGNFMLQTAWDKSTVLVVSVSWCGQCHGVGSAMVWAVSWCGQCHGGGSVMVWAVSWWCQCHGVGSVMVWAVSWWWQCHGVGRNPACWSDGSCSCDRCNDGHQISRRHPAASRDSTHGPLRWTVSA